MMSSPNTPNQDIDNINNEIPDINEWSDSISMPWLDTDVDENSESETPDDENSESETPESDNSNEYSISSAATIEPIPLYDDVFGESLESKVEEKQEEEKQEEEKQEEEKQEEEPSYDCAVCYCSLNVENIVNTTCNHKYCKKCFFRWMKTSPSCPLCRKNLVSRTQWYENCDMNAELTLLQALNEDASSKLIHTKQELMQKTYLNQDMANANERLKIWNKQEMRRKISIREDIDYSRGYLKALNEIFPSKSIKDKLKNYSRSYKNCRFANGYLAGYYEKNEITNSFKRSFTRNEPTSDEEMHTTDNAGAVCM